jgi:phosphoenolpyruvate phosphomutase
VPRLITRRCFVSLLTPHCSLPLLPLLSNFNNARILVRKLEQRGIAGACIEDKLFPKTNSLLGTSEGKPLASIEEFSSKIRAMKDTQRDPDFVVVARIEAFISGWGLDEALKRAEAYKAAGADAVLIHSKKSDDKEIASFCKAWDGKHPVVIVPTKYYTTPTQTFKDWKVGGVIWANVSQHNAPQRSAAEWRTSRQLIVRARAHLLTSPCAALSVSLFSSTTCVVA